MKARAKVILTVAAFLAVAAVVFLSFADFTFSKDHAAWVFRHQQQKFEAAALALLTGGEPDLPPGVHEALICGQADSCVDFSMGGAGFGSSTRYWGVVYTEEDQPVGFQGMTPPWSFNGEVWSWQEEQGDNEAWVKQLADHWYLYEARF